MTKYLIPFFAAMVLITGCSKPTETVIPSDMSQWDSVLAPAVKKLPEEDRKLLAAFVARAKTGELLGKGEGIPFGTTVGDAISLQKKWTEDQRIKAEEEKALKEKLAKEAEAAKRLINESVTVALLSKNQRPRDFHAGRFEDQQIFIVGIENKTHKRIMGVSGEMTFIDVFDKVVGSMNFAASEEIRPGSTIKWTGVRSYNQFDKDQRAMWNLEEGKYKVMFTPWEVIFEGGEKLSAPR
ncbi:hypothetical protein [Delftia sp. WSY_7]|uniref:hypothetical protein n=1 Tax=Delftia sp. WSY_7 TaxID=3367202 RepID=UPI00370CF498